jgi:hypothetical protein
MITVSAATVVTSLLLLADGPSGIHDQHDALQVWVAPDTVRVNPETGRYFEDHRGLDQERPAGNYRVHNSVWDAASGRVSLWSARNEFVSFQVVVGSSQPIQGIRLTLDGLAGPDGQRLAGRNVALFRAWHVRVRSPSAGYARTSLGAGWYPDGLLPAAEDGTVTCDLPDARNLIGPSHRYQTIWVDVCVPRDRADAPPGEYAGQLRISWPGGQKELRVTLTVWDFALPDEIHCRGDIWNGSLQAMTDEQELWWYQLLRQHRLQPGVAYYRPGLKIEGTQVTLDWTTYDRRLSKYLDGTAFTDKYGYWGPGSAVPLEHLLLPFDCNKKGRAGGGWPLSLPATGPSPDFERVWVETARQVRQHLDARPETRQCRKVVFLGGLDESYNREAYAKMIYYSQLLRQGLGKEWFQYRIDGGYDSAAMEQLQPHVDLWVCHTAGFDADKMARFRRLGVEPWFYGPMVYERAANSACGSNTFTDLDLLTCRGVGWVAWKLRSGFCQWEFDAFYDDTGRLRRPSEPFEKGWTEAMNCRYGGHEYNGSGLLIYRGALAGRERPIPSIRLKAHRRGLQDYEYFWLLRQARREQQADEMVNSIVIATPFGRAAVGNVDTWKHNGEDWDQVRIRAGELLHAANRK